MDVALTSPDHAALMTHESTMICDRCAVMQAICIRLFSPAASGSASITTIEIGLKRKRKRRKKKEEKKKEERKKKEKIKR